MKKKRQDPDKEPAGLAMKVVAIRYLPASEPDCEGVARLYNACTGELLDCVFAEAGRYRRAIDCGHITEIERFVVPDEEFMAFFAEAALCEEAGIGAFVARAQELFVGMPDYFVEAARTDQDGG